MEDDFESSALPALQQSALRNDPEALKYLHELTGCSLEELGRAPQRLTDMKSEILQQTQELAFENYKSFIHTADCCKEIFRDFVNMQENVHRSLEKLPELSKLCATFHTEAEQILTKRRTASLTLQHHSQLLEMLEIPQLMDTCVKNRYYEEALQLRAHTQRLSKKYPDISIIQAIAEEVEAGAAQMVSGLLQTLRQDVQLTDCLRAMGHLRGAAVFSEPELRIHFLAARNAWLTKELAVLPSEPYLAVAKLVETNRLHLFNIITQYKAVFSSGTDDGGPLLFGWVLQKVEQFLAKLTTLLPLLADRVPAALAQCMHFALSLGRHGVDFRPVLVTLFERTIATQYTNRLTTATRAFATDLPSTGLTAHVTIPDSETSGATPTVTMPLSVMSHPVLAVLANSLLSAFNELRECAPLAIADTAAVSLRTALTDTVATLLAYHKRTSPSFDQRDAAMFESICLHFSRSVAPCAVRCLAAIYPREPFRPGMPLGGQVHDPLELISLPDILAPLLKLFPNITVPPNALLSRAPDPALELKLAVEPTPVESTASSESVPDAAEENPAAVAAAESMDGLSHTPDELAQSEPLSATTSFAPSLDALDAVGEQSVLDTSIGALDEGLEGESEGAGEGEARGASEDQTRGLELSAAVTAEPEDGDKGNAKDESAILNDTTVVVDPPADPPAALEEASRGLALDDVAVGEDVNGEAHAALEGEGGVAQDETVTAEPAADDAAGAAAASGEAAESAEAAVTVDVSEDSLTVSDKINFEPNTAVLTGRAKRVLKHLAETLNAHPLISLVEIAGHCSNSGSSSEANIFEQKVSEARAAAVVADLVAHGVDATRLIARGYGDTQPIATNATADGRARNRRVEFVILARNGVSVKEAAETKAEDHEPTVLVRDRQLAVSERINFEPNTADLVPRAKRVVRTIAETLKRHPELVRVEVAGHCSDSGSRKEDDEKEQRISEARATAVVMHLVQLGVDSTRLIARGYGDTQPIATNATADGRARNRRVEFVILERAPLSS